MAACNICAKTVEEIYTINSYSICRLCLQNGYRNIDRKRYKDKDIINKLGISYCNTCKCIKDLNEFVNVKNHYYKCKECNNREAKVKVNCSICNLSVNKNCLSEHKKTHNKVK